MNLHPIFKLREKATEGIILLLDSVVLGTNGAHYRHLDTREKIGDADNPLFLSMERREKVLGNITFCRRNSDWYVRYFAFDNTIQSAGKKKSTSDQGGLLKQELSKFFSNVFSGEYDETEVRSFYAYIDPRNEKSLWMSENFGFETVAKIATQTFSRVNPKKSSRIQKIDDWDEIKELVNSHFKGFNYYNDVHVKQPPFYVIRDDNQKIIALTKISKANWEIKRLPGKFGGVLTNVIPWIPGLRKIIRPSNHTFIVPEAVIVKEDYPELLTELFEGILAQEEEHLMIWWTDSSAPLYQKVNKKVSWGLLHKLVGVSHANLVVKKNENTQLEKSHQPYYTIGYDFI